MRLYRKGLPRPGCCWFETKEEALNYEGRGVDESKISKVVVISGEFNSYFEENGVGYKLSREGFEYLSNRIETFDRHEFESLSEDPRYHRFF